VVGWKRAFVAIVALAFFGVESPVWADGPAEPEKRAAAAFSAGQEAFDRGDYR
jgi:hypothetical protein